MELADFREIIHQLASSIAVRDIHCLARRKPDQSNWEIILIRNGQTP